MAHLPDLVHWQDVRADDAVLVRAGTIHAIGAGLVIAEIQQRSDATFRLFDYGRSRELHLDGAVGAATAGPSAPQPAAERLSDARLVVARSPYFVFERIDLTPDSYWEVDAASETWILLLEGDANFDLLRAQSGEAVFVENQRIRVRAGSAGIKGLMAYVASEPEHTRLLSRNGEPRGAMVERFPELAAVAGRRAECATMGCPLMIRARRIAFIGNSLPRRCGIATFTTDLQQAVAAGPTAIVDLDRRHDRSRPQLWLSENGGLRGPRRQVWRTTSRPPTIINQGGFDAVSLQHEFGIFGGEAGGYILTLLERLRVPIVTTLHTILAEPSDAQRRVLDRIVSLSSKIITMSEMGRDLLLSGYDVEAGKVTVIAHGIPDFDFVEPDAAKVNLGFTGKDRHPNVRPSVAQQGH